MDPQAITPPVDSRLAGLAHYGGARACPLGPPAWPLPDEEVRAALEAAFASGDWGRYYGPHVQGLAEELAAYHGVELAIPCSSGTVAVELALRGVGVAAGDEVLLAAYDFPGNFRAIEAIGAVPVLVDVDPQNWNLAADELPAAWSPKARAVVVSHLHSGVVDMSRVMQFARERGLAVVEDACQCPGATIEGRRAGTWGDAGVLSFGGSKLLTAGRGGAVLTQRADVAQRIKVFSDRGNQAFPLSELQAAVLRPQLAKLDARNAARGRAAARLIAALAGAPGLRPLVNSLQESEPGYYKLGWQFRAEELAGCDRAQFIHCVQAEGIALDAGFRGFAARGPRRCRKVGSLAEARRAAEGALLLHHPVLLAADEDLNCVAKGLGKVVAALSGSAS
jgi:dTDP-4-amino-4,6-dideoxygalactose transaminase